MSSINEKLGIRPAGKRSMMKLPGNRADAVLITAAKCPSCGHRYARGSYTRPGWYWCTWCTHHWDPKTVIAPDPE